MNTLNQQHNICPHWKLRVRYYPGFGTFIDGYSNITGKWMSIKRISILDVSKDKNR